MNGGSPGHWSRRLVLGWLGSSAVMSAALAQPAGGPRPGLGAGGPPGAGTGEDPQRELAVRRQEVALLHRKVDLRGARLLRAGQAIDVQPPVAHLLIVHIWAVECPPCIEELPILRRIAESLGRMPQVKIVLVSETTDLSTLNRFIAAHQNDMPRVEQYQSIDDRLRSSLQNNAQPTTLLVDALGVVRQAFLGSLKHRRAEFVDAISRMSRTL
jgi:thiol-disulfide isomerase/thioredoxin